MSARRTRCAMGLVLGLAIAACSPAATPSGAPAASAGPGANAGGASRGPSAETPAQMDQAEATLRDQIRDRAGLANLGSGASELAGLMDSAGSRGLQAAAAKLEPRIAPTAVAPTARLAVLTTPGTVIFAPWEFTTSWFDRLMTNGVGNRITNDRDTLPNCVPGDGTCTGKEPKHQPPGQESGSETDHEDPVTDKVTIGGQAGTVTTTVSSTVAFDGSKVSMDLEIKLHGEVHDANGATVIQIDAVGTGHIDGDACPDASGVAALHISFTASEQYAGSGVQGSSYGLEQDFSADVRVHADDNANLAGIEVIAKAHETSTGGVPPAGGGAGSLTAHEYNAGFTRTLGYDATGGFGAATTTNESADSVQATSLYLGMALFTEYPAKIAAKATESAWRSGMCVRLSASPTDATVGNDSRTEVRVIVRQRYEDVELDKPVVAALDSGPKAIEPAGQGQPAPATFTYTAGSKDGDTGLVGFTSTSNRGIGKTTASFTVGGGWNADRHDGQSTITGQKCGGLDGVWNLVVKITSPQVVQTGTYVITINGTTHLGTYTIHSRTVSDPGITTTIVGSGKAGVAEQPDGTLRMTIFGTTVIGTAEGQSVSIPLPDQFFTWTRGGTCP